MTHLLEQLFRGAVGHAHLAATLAVGIAVLAVFVQWERRGRQIAVVFTVVAALLVDAMLYPSTQAMLLPGPLHPFIAGQSFRLVQLLTALGLLARLIVKGLPRRIDAATVLWTAFFAWYVTAGVVGLLEGHDRHLVTARAMFALETGGLAALAAGVPVRDWLDDRGLPRLVRWAAVPALANFVLAEAGVRVAADLPQLPLLDFGQMGSDAATLYPTVGLLGLATELVRRQRRPTVVVAGIVLLLAPLASPQRAARLAIAVTVAVFVAAVMWPRRRRFRARGGDWALAGLCLAAVVATPIFVRSAMGERPPSLVAAIPFSDYTVQALDREYRQGSVQSRYNEWAAATPLIRDRPVFGNGLGTTFVHYEPGTREFVDYDLANNIPLDLLVRSGAIGLALFTAAAAATFAGAWRAWRRLASDRAAMLAAMTVAVLAGFLAKGMVESVINEYHMTPLFGFLLGLASALAAALVTDDGPRGRRPARTGSAGAPPAGEPTT